MLDGGLPTAYRLYNALQWIVFSWCRVRCVSVEHTNNGHSSKFQVLDSSSSVPFSVVSYSSYGCSALCQYCNLFMSQLWWCADHDIIWRELKDLASQLSANSFDTGGEGTVLDELQCLRVDMIMMIPKIGKSIRRSKDRTQVSICWPS